MFVLNDGIFRNIVFSLLYVSDIIAMEQYQGIK
jgi:hypothetical protein